ncbi:MAG: DUF1501 domain-containing protein, partial [Verrucomicrobiia bacterium]
MKPIPEINLDLHQTRRAFLGNAGVGVGSSALGSLLGGHSALGVDPMVSTFAAKAKRVIFLCMAGGPSHLETFDYKPELDRLNGKAMPESFTKGQPIA